MSDDVTQLLQAIQTGNQLATDQLLPMVYTELRRLAGSKLANENPSTLQATALVHEVYLRLTNSDSVQWENRAHFFSAAAEAMRRILIDHARHKRRLKRGGGARRVELADADHVVLPVADELLDLNTALMRLEEEFPERAEVVKLRFFGGLTMEQIADVRQSSLRTVERHWALARAWLYREMGESGRNQEELGGNCERTTH